MPLLIDSTPYLINRTAIGRIVADTAKAFAGEGVSFRYLKTETKAFELPDLRARLIRRKFMRAVDKPVNFLVQQQIASMISGGGRRRADGRRVLYFDPLYVLFHGNIDPDFVFVLDLTPITHSAWHRPNVVLLYKAAFRKLAESKCEIISISKSTTLDLRANFGVHGSRIHTLPLYLPEFGSKERRTDRSESDSRYFLFVGSLESRKNIASLCKAFAHSRMAAQGYRLRIVGGDGNGADEIRRVAEATSGVELLGFVDDNKLDELYRGCSAFLYPSLWEGFGLPLLEAMARGVPCVATMTGASPEVGGDAVIYVDPCDLLSISRGIREAAGLSETERKDRAERGLELSRQFNFDRYVSTLKQILSGDRGYGAKSI